MPEDGPAPSGAKEALDNKAEWKGKLKEQKPAPLPPDLAAQSQAAPPAPPQPAQQPKPKSGPPSAGARSARAGRSARTGGAGSRAAPGSPAAEQAAADAATPDPTAKGAVPGLRGAGADQPRYPGPITLATLDEPPVPLPRTKEQEVEDVKAAEKAIRLAAAQTSDTDALDDWFPRIKNRFRLVSLGYVGDFESGFRIEGGINPQIEIEDEEEELKSKNLPIKGKDATKIVYETATVGGSKVGVIMTADPLGADHPMGSDTGGGQAPLMGQLPTNPKKFSEPNRRFVRGHLLNYDLGGPGEDRNLFPITAEANSKHSSKVEQTVKKWVNEDRLWVRYKVSVADATDLMPLKGKSGSGLNAINSRLEIEVATLSTKLKPVKSYTIHVESLYDPAEIKKGAATELEDAETAASDKSITKDTPTGVAAADPNLLNVQQPRIFSKQEIPIFPEHIRADLARWHNTGLRKEGTKERIKNIKYIKDERVNALYEAYELAKTRPDVGDEGRDISGLRDDFLTQFRYVVGFWDDIVDEVDTYLNSK